MKSCYSLLVEYLISCQSFFVVRGGYRRPSGQKHISIKLRLHNSEKNIKENENRIVLTL